MTALAWLLVAVGAFVGAPLRFLVERRLVGAYPWGTFVVNVVGSAILGALAARAAHGSTWLALVGIGFCGALTTFGGFAAQVHDLAVGEPGATVGRRAGASIGYAVASVAVCVVVAGIGYVTVSPT